MFGCRLVATRQSGWSASTASTTSSARSSSAAAPRTRDELCEADRAAGIHHPADRATPGRPRALRPRHLHGSSAGHLAFDDIAKSYGDTPALRGVSFDVHAGEIFGLLGPNGAGKSTLIRILMDIIRPDSGEVRVFGEPRRRAHLDRLGYLPEERGLYTKLTVTDVMTYFGALKGLSRAEARRRSSEWLERVELPHVAGWKIDRLSKGMSQKVQIASVLLADPRLCVLDEPTTGLDPVNVSTGAGSTVRAPAQRRTTILSTHQMNQVEALCDRVALINRGRLMVYGEVDEVRRDHSLPEVRVHARSAAGSPRSRERDR